MKIYHWVTIGISLLLVAPVAAFTSDGANELPLNEHRDTGALDARSGGSPAERGDTPWTDMFPRPALPSAERDRPRLSDGGPMTQVADQVLTDGERLTLALETATPHEALSLLLAYADRTDLPPVPAGLPPGEALRSSGIDPATLPYALDGPVGDLWSAILVAQHMQEEATRELSAEEVRTLTDGTVWTLVEVPDAAPTPEGEETPIGAWTGESVPALSSSERRAIIEKVDQDMMAAAALHLLTTIEDVVPRLGEQVPASNPVQQPNPCESDPMFSLGTLLAIDGPASARFVDDYILSIDLGGDDCYDNSAGGAETGIAIAIDLSGNEHYTALGNTSEPIIAQGAASLGIGILLDAAGDDEYTAGVETSAPEPGPIADAATVIAQGAGTDGGIGLLFDLGGSDRLVAEARTSGNNATVLAQGSGSSIGIGIASASPLAGDTEWSVVADSVRHMVLEEPFYRKYLIGGGDATVQGAAGSISIGALVDGSGNDLYDVLVSGGRGLTRGQGTGDGGVGVLVDALGADTYQIKADGFESLATIVDSPLFCWSAFTNVVTKDTEVLAQGVGKSTGIGILADARGGNGGNSFTLESLTGAHAQTEVRDSADPSQCTNRANSTATTGTAYVLGQGAGRTGIGLLLGSLEHDTYVADVEVGTDATALVSVGVERVENAEGTAFDSRIDGQGFGSTGIGILLDPTGDDTYHWETGLSSVQRTSAGDLPGLMGDAKALGLGYIGTAIAVGWHLDLQGEDSYIIPEAGDNSCWTHPESAGGALASVLARGRDWNLPDPLSICI